MQPVKKLFSDPYLNILHTNIENNIFDKSILTEYMGSDKGFKIGEYKSSIVEILVSILHKDMTEARIQYVDNILEKFVLSEEDAARLWMGLKIDQYFRCFFKSSMPRNDGSMLRACLKRDVGDKSIEYIDKHDPVIALEEAVKENSIAILSSLVSNYINSIPEKFSEEEDFPQISSDHINYFLQTALAEKKWNSALLLYKYLEVVDQNRAAAGIGVELGRVLQKSKYVSDPGRVMAAIRSVDSRFIKAPKGVISFEEGALAAAGGMRLTKAGAGEPSVFESLADRGVLLGILLERIKFSAKDDNAARHFKSVTTKYRLTLSDLDSMAECMVKNDKYEYLKDFQEIKRPSEVIEYKDYILRFACKEDNFDQFIKIMRSPLVLSTEGLLISDDDALKALTTKYERPNILLKLIYEKLHQISESEESEEEEKPERAWNFLENLYTSCLSTGKKESSSVILQYLGKIDPTKALVEMAEDGIILDRGIRDVPENIVVKPGKVVWHYSSGCASRNSDMESSAEDLPSFRGSVAAASSNEVFRVKPVPVAGAAEDSLDVMLSKVCAPKAHRDREGEGVVRAALVQTRLSHDALDTLVSSASVPVAKFAAAKFIAS